MSKTLEKVRRFIERHSMLQDPSGAGAGGVVVAVSGGPDSVALLDILARLRMPDGRGAAGGHKTDEGQGARDWREDGFPVHPSPLAHAPSTASRLRVAHLDHKLRVRESAEDAEFVRRLADRYGLPVTLGEADVRAEAGRTGRGIEEVARELRYDFLLRAAREAGYVRIAVGHTMSDQAETFLMRLARGAGLRGLASMRPVGLAHDFARDEAGPESRTPVIEAAGVMTETNNALVDVPPLPLLIRPLLCITRDEVEDYCREHNLEFRTDATNLNADYTRNRVRRDVLPALRAVNPRAVESIARATEIIASDEDALDHLASRLLDGARVVRRVEGLRNEKDERRRLEAATYSATAILEQPAGLRRRMIIEAIRRERAARLTRSAGGAQITSAHVASVESLLSGQVSGNRVTLSGGLDAWREFDAIVFMPSARGDSTGGLYEYEISGSHTHVETSGFHISLERDVPSHMLESIINQSRERRRRTGSDWMTAALDECALPDRLIIRPRRAGARARVLGQRKTKKLKNLMIDHKIPPSRRSAWPVVTTPDDCYVWSPGLPPALEYAARDKSTRLAILRASDT
ncbi:MAG TPA: tRNA lysidine(34) synthetase TilS [Blastocatellia bacterium]